MKPRDTLYSIPISGLEREALIHLLKLITLDDFTPELVSVLVRLDKAEPVNR